MFGLELENQSKECQEQPGDNYAPTSWANAKAQILALWFTKLVTLS